MLLVAFIVVVTYLGCRRPLDRAEQKTLWPIVAERLCLMLLIVTALASAGVEGWQIGLGGSWRWHCASAAGSVAVVVGIDVAVLGYARAVRVRTPSDAVGGDGLLRAGSAAVPLVLCAFWEELFYRALFFHLFSPLGAPLAVLTGATLFAYHHRFGGRLLIAYSFGFGTLFGILYVVTNSLPAVAVAHAAGNLFVVLRLRAKRVARPEKIPQVF